MLENKGRGDLVSCAQCLASTTAGPLPLIQCVLVDFAILHDERHGLDADITIRGVEEFRVATDDGDIPSRTVVKPSMSKLCAVMAAIALPARALAKHPVSIARSNLQFPPVMTDH